MYVWLLQIYIYIYEKQNKFFLQNSRNHDLWNKFFLLGNIFYFAHHDVKWGKEG